MLHQNDLSGSTQSTFAFAIIHPKISPWCVLEVVLNISPQNLIYISIKNASWTHLKIILKFGLDFIYEFCHLLFPCSLSIMFSVIETFGPERDDIISLSVLNDVFCRTLSRIPRVSQNFLKFFKQCFRTKFLREFPCGISSIFV